MIGPGTGLTGLHCHTLAIRLPLVGSPPIATDSPPLTAADNRRLTAVDDGLCFCRKYVLNSLLVVA
jgi:hypothetical protein